MKKKQWKKMKKSIIFLLIVVFLYLGTSFFYSQKIVNSIKNSFNLFITILPIFLIVIMFMALVNLIPNKIVKKYLGKDSKFISWFISSIGGMLSHGPIYSWYPFLESMKKKGMSYGKIATFLYSRAIKIPLLPLMISFFGLKFTIIYNIYLFIFSILQGFSIDIILEKKK